MAEVGVGAAAPKQYPPVAIAEKDAGKNGANFHSEYPSATNEELWNGLMAEAHKLTELGINLTVDEAAKVIRGAGKQGPIAVELTLQVADKGIAITVTKYPGMLLNGKVDKGLRRLLNAVPKHVDKKRAELAALREAAAPQDGFKPAR